MKLIRSLFLLLSLGGLLVAQTPLLATQPAPASTTPPAKVYTPEELDHLLAPIALYPDPLLAQILPGATSPSDIVLAYRYVSTKKDPNKIDQQPWEESVKALARYPDVLKMMDEKLDWTTELGEAFIAQPKDIFDSVQRLRAKAQAAGNLKDSPQQVIVQEKEVIKIVPADPQVIYVPVYQPSVVYVQQPPSAAVSVITFGAGLALGIWIHNELDWHSHTVYYHNSGWHGGYNGGHNNINIDNSTNINIGNGNGNKVGNGGNVWKPQNKPRPTPYGQDNRNGSGANNNWSSKPGHGANGPSTNRPSTLPAQSNTQQKPSRPTQPSTAQNSSRPQPVNESSKPRFTGMSERPASSNRSAPVNRSGGRDRNN